MSQNKKNNLLDIKYIEEYHNKQNIDDLKEFEKLEELEEQQNLKDFEEQQNLKDFEELEEISTNYNIDSLQTALFNNSLNKLYCNQSKINKNPFIFNHEVKPKYKITNQQHSGRCWIFATNNLLRVMAAKELKIDNKATDSEDSEDLEFSETYIYFWDKLEKYHRSLHYYLKIKKMDETKRIPYMLYLLNRSLEDGGQWDMVKELIKKYGIVPKQAMPDSHHSKNSDDIIHFLREMLKNDFIKLDSTKPINYKLQIKAMTTNIYEFLIGFLGQPPKEFDFTYKIKDQVKIINKLTPHSLLELIKFNPDDWVSVVNDPRPRNPYNNYYQIEFIGNVKHQHVGWLNFEIERMEELAKESIDKNIPVWFGCDVNAERDKDSGIMDVNIIDYRKAYNLENNINKQNRLETYLSLPNHAMLIVGYNYNNEKIERWKIENSWGNTIGNKGYLLMTNDWFYEYVYQIVVHKSLLTKKEKQIIKTEPRIIPPWDPLGTLA
jgi:bleomycin hydrolase